MIDYFIVMAKTCYWMAHEEIINRVNCADTPCIKYAYPRVKRYVGRKKQNKEGIKSIFK
jgi:hypothetical protein